MKRIFLRFLVVLPLLFAVGALSTYGQQDAKAEAQARKEKQREEKNARKEEKRQLNQVIRRYESLRDSVGRAFCKANPPSAIFSPHDSAFSITDVICGGDEDTGMIILSFNATSRLLDPFYLYIGGSNNGTQIVTGRDIHRSASIYGQRYTLRTGMAEEVYVTFFDVNRSLKVLDRVEISVGLYDNLMNTIIMRNVPIFWTASDRSIRNYIRAQAEQEKAARETTKE